MGQLAGRLSELSAVILPDLLSLEVEPAQPAIYDASIRLRRLYVDLESGAEHYLIRYPRGLKAARHHHSVAHTIIVLEGKLRVNDLTIGPGSYCHFPATTVMHHEPAAGSDCNFVTIFDGPFDVFTDNDLGT